jgi:hypothetical protein
MKERKLFTPLFWIDSFERVVATFGEALLAFFIAGATFTQVDWGTAFAISGMAAAAAQLKAIVAAAKADTDTASFVVDSKELK